MTTTQQFKSRHYQLTVCMAGFGGLITAIQGLLVGFSLATGEVWMTEDVESTLTIARHCLNSTVDMIDSFGMQQ